MGEYVPGAITSLFTTSNATTSSSKKLKRDADIKTDGKKDTAVADDLFSKPQATTSTLKATVIQPKKRATAADTAHGKKKKQKRQEKTKQVVAPRSQSDDEADSHASEEENEENKESESEDEEDAQNDDEKNSRTAFVGNVPIKPFMEEVEGEAKPGTALKKLEKALRKTFSEFGKVESVRLRSLGLKSVKVPSGSDYHLVRKVAVAKGNLDDRLDTCNAFVVFQNSDSVDEAVKKVDSTVFHGNHLRVDSLRESSKGRVFDRKRTVFVGNLVFEASEEECRAHFVKKLGEDAVKSVRVVRDPVTNLGRGFAYVLLSDPSLVVKAVAELNDTKLRNRPIRVTKCERSSSKKDAKIALKKKQENESPGKKPRRSFAGKEATDPSEGHLPKSRRKGATLAQKAANKPKAKKSKSPSRSKKDVKKSHK